MLLAIDGQFGIEEHSTIRCISGQFIGRKINNRTKCFILLCLYSTYGGCALLSYGGCIENSLYVAFQTNSSDDKLKTETVRQMLYSFVLVRHAWWLYREFPVETKGNVFCVFTHVASIYANLLESKESVYTRKEFNSHRTGLGHKHGRRFIVLGHKYGHHDVM